MNDATAIPCTATPSSDIPIIELPRVSSSAPEEVRSLIHAATPTVIVNDVAIRTMPRLLSPTALKTAFGDDAVTVSVSKRGDFRYDAGSTSPQRLPFTEFADYVETASEPGGERRYLSQFPLDAIPLGRGVDLVEPPYIPGGTLRIAENLWFGPAGTISPFHVDRSHNLLVQHWGRKHVVMVAPQYSSIMQPGPKNSRSPHVSSLHLVTDSGGVDLSHLDAPCFETVVHPGEILFIPAFWWHNVTAIDAAISTNHWWRPPIDACLYPNFFRMLSSRGVYDDLSVVHRWVDVAPHELDTGLCVHLAHEGHTFGAAALASALVTAFCQKTLRALGIGVSERSDGALESKIDFGPSRTVVSALAAQGVVDNSQAALLFSWLALAAEISGEPESREYGPVRTAAIHELIRRLHHDCGGWLST